MARSANPSPSREIRKWQVYLADLSPQRGTGPGKVRPVVVVQTDLLNGVHPSTVICPLTSTIRREAEVLRVHLMPGEAGLTRHSDIMVDQIRAIDNRRLRRPLGMIHRRSRVKLAENLAILLAWAAAWPAGGRVPASETYRGLRLRRARTNAR